MTMRIGRRGLAWGAIVALLGGAPGPATGGPIVITGADAGGGADVRVFDAATGALLASFFAFAPEFLGGVRVGSVDGNEDGIPDVVVAAGPGGGPHVRVFDGAALLGGSLVELVGFFAYDPGLLGGMYVAGGNGAALPATGGLTGVTAGAGLTGGGTSGAVTVSLLPCPANGVLKATGPGAWSCGTDADSGGTITGVTAGAGLTGGGTSGAVTLAVDTTAIQARVTGSCPAGQYVQGIGATGVPACVADANSGGTVTSVSAGSGLTGTPNPITGVGTLAVAFGGSGAAGTAARSDHDHDAAYWKLGGNAGTAPGPQFLGTTDGQALELRVNGQRALRLEPETTDASFGASPGLVGGFGGNAGSGVAGATIGGGGSAAMSPFCGGSCANRVTDSFGTVSGGLGNRAGDAAGTSEDRRYATVGGGLGNTAGGEATTVGGGRVNTAGGVFATIGGGFVNTASGDEATVGGGAFNTASNIDATVGGGGQNTASGFQATVAGGSLNTASGDQATVGGGQANTASGLFATVAGGDSNTASGDFSFAVGRRALTQDSGGTSHKGALVLVDSNDFDFHSATDNELAVRATGGARIVSAIDGSGVPTAGVSLAAGASAWGTVSDRASKAHFAPVDGDALLERLAGIPIQTWSWKSQAPGIRHMGPVAQDFHAAFGLGEDPRRISTVDADGVALAAIQALHARNRALEAQARALEARAEALRARVEALERALEARQVSASSR
jgi:hypothetical protein